MNVNDATPAAKVLHAYADLVEPLLEGTEAMRAAGERLLKKWPAEDANDYKVRLAVATLFPAYQRTVQTLTGKPFSKAITVNEDVPAKIKAWLPDIDRQGRNLDAFTAEITQAALGIGLAGILVEYPVVAPKEDGKPITQDEEKQQGLRPYWVPIRTKDLLGWRAVYGSNGWRLSQLRIMQSVEEDDGAFGTKLIPQVLVLEPGKWARYRKRMNHSMQEEWFVFGDGVTTLQEIPFVPVYGERVGYMMGKPPLLTLAHLNVKHWQSQSDQDTILHVARVPILFAAGFPESTAIVFSTNQAIRSDMPDAKLSWIEHTGASIDAGKVSLDDLKEEMRQAGAELLALKPGVITATQVSSENEVGMCALKRITLGVQDAINQALQYTAEWIGLPTGGTVKLFADFGAAMLAETSSQILTTAAQTGLISNETWFHEMQRRGIVDAELDFEEERTRIGEQGPALGLAGDLPDDPTDPTDPGDPTDPTDPGDPGDPANPGDPIQQRKPGQPGKPGRPVAPQAPLEATPAIDYQPILREALSALQAMGAREQAPANITVEAPQITVNVPEQPPATINIAPAAITVNTPDITIEAPVVNVTPAAITVEAPTVNVAPPAVTVEAPVVNIAPQPITVEAPQVTIQQVKPTEIQFNEDADGNITGARMN